MTLEGIAASPGIGVGPIFCFEAEDFAVKDHRVEPHEIDAEIARLHTGLAQARSDLQRLHDGIAAELGADAAAIYDAHLLMVDDPELKKHVEAGIRGESQNAAFAFRRYMSSVAARVPFFKVGRRSPTPRSSLKIAIRRTANVNYCF